METLVVLADVRVEAVEVEVLAVQGGCPWGSVVLPPPQFKSVDVICGPPVAVQVSGIEF